ncbi:hypothetical protein HPB47_003269 [Ixodes persulcatus]|uniref:Uncharacterized protein n=1 Tax=Ixodes persulcatus TaxID=34615 RepID=A0AC60PIY3_IXOPE|nr:hypothetical protein HPB47_003269 [Ixodes persulcatus]
MIEDRRFLWDIRHPDYHKKNLKERAFADITGALGFGDRIDKVKNKWTNLRSQYQRENRKVKDTQRSGAGADDVHVPKWVHFKKMRFLSSGAPEAPSESTAEAPEAVHVSQEDMDACHVPEDYRSEDESPPPEAPAKRSRRQSTEELAPNKAALLQAAVNSLKSAREVEPDECRGFGLMMEGLARTIPRGTSRQLGMLAAHKALVEAAISAQVVVVAAPE